MTPEEALTICRLAKGAFPATSMDEFTPESWSLALEDERFEDARDALKYLMRAQTFIHVSDIVKRVAAVRRDRILAFGPMPDPPRELDDDPEGYQRWVRATVKAIGDGDLTERPALPAGTPRSINYADVFQDVDGNLQVSTARRAQVEVEVDQ